MEQTVNLLSYDFVGASPTSGTNIYSLRFMMKAFTVFPKQEQQLRQLCRKLQDIGEINCSFDDFCSIYIEWYHKTYPTSAKVSLVGVLTLDYVFWDFVNYIAQRDI